MLQASPYEDKRRVLQERLKRIESQVLSLLAVLAQKYKY
jgi:hypothetical protein